MPYVDDSGETGPGPSWKWIVTIIVAVVTPTIGGLLFWIAASVATMTATMPSVNLRLDTTAKQLDAIQGELATINSTLATQQTGQALLEQQFKEMDARLDRVEDESDNNKDALTDMATANEKRSARAAAKLHQKSN